MVASDLLHDGFLAYNFGNTLGNMRSNFSGYVLSSVVCRRSSVVVEIILQLRKCGFVFVFIQFMVPSNSARTSRGVTCDCIYHIHGNYLFVFLSFLWFYWCVL